MTTYTKAWLVCLVWIGFFAVLLIGIGIEVLTGASMPMALVFGAVGYFAMIIIAQSFPKCAGCGEPVNMPHDDGEVTHQGMALIRPARPKRECGYCGADLKEPR
ncbi:hypothetical protein [Aurantiacibacter aquimixticola]|uniref:Uncharacterized protein n=1 Tax=Aurantiacibacter aquimixticola TaxID=1958945 RepID=A0A419RSL1_9SPHN|nr:hypothetical protein [Aurantiacibacter aquimixticola]RJY08793.1 hypothetical protein D6201_04940 [Aurantiacibacter aquimixticola]